MVMLQIAYLSIWSYKGHVCYLRESKSYLFYLHATSKNEIHICSNKHKTGLVYRLLLSSAKCTLVAYIANSMDQTGAVRPEFILFASTITVVWSSLEYMQQM